MKSQDQLQEDLQKQQVLAHQQWLKHPVTIQMLRWIGGRGKHYIEKLQDGILLASNKDQEDKLRSCITTCKAIEMTISDSNLFVSETINKQ